ncbi:DegT/DnrJ/EryC1/StrS family aminotransferase [Nocardia sp. CA-107356]|uniref:DegT/DnrJ/EryC1/StrS family aminotransferase n=1 Tax=Nocardia sp. CA-107356 TaxID=3239972 RepID=UPI003D9254FC
MHYPPNHLQPAFARWSRLLPITETAARQIMSLPFHPEMSDQGVSILTLAESAPGHCLWSATDSTSWAS